MAREYTTFTSLAPHAGAHRAAGPLDIVRSWQSLEGASLVEAVMEERDEEYRDDYR